MYIDYFIFQSIFCFNNVSYGCVIIYLYLRMYIKTYGQDPQQLIQKIDKKGGKNLATNSPEGRNLHKIIYRRSISKTQKLHNKNQVQLDDETCNENKNHKSASENHITPSNDRPASPRFYQSSYFGISLRNNRLREVKQKYRSKGKQKVNQKVKQQLINIITKNGFKITTHKNNIIKSKIRSHSTVNRQKKSAQVIQFSVSGRPVSRSIRMPLQKKMSPEIFNIQKVKNNQAVLDLSKLNKYLLEQKKDFNINMNGSSNSHINRSIIRQFNDINLNCRSSRIHDYLQIYEKIAPKKVEQSPQQVRRKTQQKEKIQNQIREKIKKELRLNKQDDHQPQILIDYRRSMSSGWKRMKFYGKTTYNSNDNLLRSNEDINHKNINNQNKKNQDKGIDKAVVNADNINPWAVHKLQQQQQFLF